MEAEELGVSSLELNKQPQSASAESPSTPAGTAVRPATQSLPSGLDSLLHSQSLEGGVQKAQPTEGARSDVPMKVDTDGRVGNVQEDRVPQLPSTQELASIAARLIVFGFTGKGPTLNKHAKDMIARGAGGVILFTRNFADPPQVAELAANLKREAGSRPLLIMVDQEGGRVQRLGQPFTTVPPARTVGRAKDPRAAESAGRILGKELRAVNVDMDLAPVMDVDTNPANPVIGNRSFGSTPELVSEMGYAVIRGLQQEGVAACAKHFPGHGDTHVDSHLSLPAVLHSRERLDAIELPPFLAAINADVASIMVAHVAVPALATDPSEASIPASMSRGALHCLRHTLHFDGVIVTDCLEMGAITKSYSVSEAAVAALAAGADMLLVCHTEEKQVAAIDAIVAAVEAGHVPLKRLREAQWRIGQLAHIYCRPAPSLSDPVETAYREALVGSIGSREHREAIAETVKQAATQGQTKEADGAAAECRNRAEIKAELDVVKQNGVTWPGLGKRVHTTGSAKPQA